MPINLDKIGKRADVEMNVVFNDVFSLIDLEFHRTPDPDVLKDLRELKVRGIQVAEWGAGLKFKLEVPRMIDIKDLAGAIAQCLEQDHGLSVLTTGRLMEKPESAEDILKRMCDRGWVVRTQKHGDRWTVVIYQSSDDLDRGRNYQGCFGLYEDLAESLKAAESLTLQAIGTN